MESPLSHLDAIRAFLAPFEPVVLYASEPGSHSVMTTIAEGVSDLVQVRWAQDGWSAANGPKPGTVHPLEVFERIPVTPGKEPLLVLGLQVDPSVSRAVLRAAGPRGWRTAFLYDHWSTYYWWQHFTTEDGRLAVLPDWLLTMDALSRDALVDVLEAFAPAAEVRRRIRIVGQPSVDAQVARVRALAADPAALDAVRRRVSGGRPFDLALLEPIVMDLGKDAAGRPLIGYDELTFLADADRWLGPPRPGATVVVKPHPRQDAGAIREFLARRWRCREAAVVERFPVDELIAAAERVYGLTTVALVVAIKAGKPTFSYQVGRNDEGIKFTNAWLERCLVPGPGVERVTGEDR